MSTFENSPRRNKGNLLQKNRERRWVRGLDWECQKNISEMASIYSVAWNIHTLRRKETSSGKSKLPWRCLRGDMNRFWKSYKTREWKYLSYLLRMNLDSRWSKIRMKKNTKYKRFCEWESEFYLNTFTKMKLDILPSPLGISTPSDWIRTMENFLSTNPIAQWVIQSIWRMC